jgi:mannose-6-phosphate isomerase-like protein (cupin superfamily)
LKNKQFTSLDFLITLMKGKKAKTDIEPTSIDAEYTKQPSDSVRSKILSKIEKLNAQARNRNSISLENPPKLDENANWLDWEAAVEGIEPPDTYDNIHLHPLESNDTRDLFLAFVKEVVPEEVHHDLIESILILEGTCECHIWTENGEKRLVRMQCGDFIEMKIGEIHDIYITSAQPAKAILQWLKVAA